MRISRFAIAQQEVERLRKAGVIQLLEGNAHFCSGADTAALEKIMEVFRQFESLIISNIESSEKLSSARQIRNCANCALTDFTIEKLLASGELQRTDYSFNFRDDEKLWNYKELRYILEASSYYTRIPLKAVRGMLGGAGGKRSNSMQGLRYGRC